MINHVSDICWTSYSVSSIFTKFLCFDLTWGECIKTTSDDPAVKQKTYARSKANLNSSEQDSRCSTRRLLANPTWNNWGRFHNNWFPARWARGVRIRSRGLQPSLEIIIWLLCFCIFSFKLFYGVRDIRRHARRSGKSRSHVFVNGLLEGCL